MNYLKYLNQPTLENVKLVHKASGMTQQQIAELLGISLQTYKYWHAPIDNKNHRKPHITTWNLLLYELEARKNGYESILDVFKKHLY